MVVETHTPMQCPYCGEKVKRISIDEWGYEREVCIVEIEPVLITSHGNTYQEHECYKGGDTEC